MLASLGATGEGQVPSGAPAKPDDTSPLSGPKKVDDVRERMMARWKAVEDQMSETAFLEQEGTLRKQLLERSTEEAWSRLPAPELPMATAAATIVDVNRPPVRREKFTIINAKGEMRTETVASKDAEKGPGPGGSAPAGTEQFVPPLSPEDQAGLLEVVRDLLPDVVWNGLTPSRKRSVSQIIKSSIEQYPSSVAGAQLDAKERSIKLRNFRIRVRGLVNAPLVKVKDSDALRAQREHWLRVIAEEFARLHPSAMEVPEFREVFEASVRRWWLTVQDEDWNPAYKVPLPEGELRGLTLEIRKAFPQVWRDRNKPIFTTLQGPISSGNLREDLKRYPATAMAGLVPVLLPIRSSVQGAYARYAAKMAFAGVDFSAGISEEELKENREAMSWVADRERVRQAAAQEKAGEESRQRFDAMRAEWKKARENRKAARRGELLELRTLGGVSAPLVVGLNLLLVSVFLLWLLTRGRSAG